MTSPLVPLARFLRSFLVIIGLIALVPSVVADDVVAVRGGLPNFVARMRQAAEDGERVRIVYLGSAAAQGAGASRPQLGYRALLTGELRKRFPKSPLVEYNHSIPGTGSWLAAFRTQTDVVRHYLPLALLVVELAVDDADQTAERVVAAVEGIVRQTRAAHPQTDILFLYALSPAQADVLRDGGTPPAIAWHEQVAEHYQLPSVNMARAVVDRIAVGELTRAEFSVDGRHPTDRGHALYVEATRPLLDQAETMDQIQLVKHPLPPPLSPRALDRARLVPYEQTVLQPDWQTGQESPLQDAQYASAAGKFRHVLVCDQPESVVTLRFRGDTVGVFGAAGPDSGDWEFSFSGGAWQRQAVFEPADAEGFRPHAALLAENLDPQAEQELRLRVASAIPDGSLGRTARIGYFLVNGSVVFDDPLKNLTALEQIDAIYSTIQPLDYDPPGDRGKHLPRTMQRLRDGGELRIVMLGDSIVNDTASSQYELLLQRMYPKCKVVKIRSVRGSTGCWWYKEENRVQQWVLNHNPDLLMIGGISQRGDVDSIREVIEQVRAARPEIEVLVMTPAFGSTDPRTDPNWTYEIDPDGEGYRSELLRMAIEEGVELIDMTGPWGRYLRQSDKARGWFMRDPVHANSRGFQILGRILERYFAPKG